MNTITTAQRISTSSDIDASIAATRRVQHLTAVARDAIDDPQTLDRDALAKAVVKALYDAHPLIGFEDALELAVIVETPPVDSSTAEAIEYVVADICSHLDAWDRLEQPALPGQG
ncbi:hypothetical protein DP107_11730 [Haloglomus irregulare]|jgi:hypothetical protein|uniref:Uncharacterized protein n=1 Tax=Haloglomus irregulare TaxID=2234134 RepID=A0A554N7X0_9EURY|nr:hypothetical protein [Haloglomus irregulare]TSD13493.1 hypothetical protein DP107_11730 [Haloglomus irregulare]